jgi:type I restriction enzyme S subunit
MIQKLCVVVIFWRSLSICASVGKPCITQIECCIHDGFVYFKGLQEKWNKYLFYVFESGDCFGGLGKLGTQLNLNTDTIGNISIPIPTNKDLEEIKSYLDDFTEKIDSLISDKQTSIETMKSYKKSLIYEYVTGKKRVKI